MGSITITPVTPGSSSLLSTRPVHRSPRRTVHRADLRKQLSSDTPELAEATNGAARLAEATTTTPQRVRELVHITDSFNKMLRVRIGAHGQSNGMVRRSHPS
ncbi:hypothetical protein GCM10018780_46740 [Streptomyces lanatus]|nr:hypothetical protein GCM10018780_46740 [Streptomyces lanatus]